MSEPTTNNQTESPSPRLTVRDVLDGKKGGARLFVIITTGYWGKLGERYLREPIKSLDEFFDNLYKSLSEGIHTYEVWEELGGGKVDGIYVCLARGRMATFRSMFGVAINQPDVMDDEDYYAAVDKAADMQ